MDLKPAFKPIDEHKSLFNLGATLDIPTSYWIRGRHGESIMMGGLGPQTSVIGPGNMFKSTLTHYMLLSAMAKIWTAIKTSASTFDSESNIHISRLKNFTQTFDQFKGLDILDTGDWVVSDATMYYADEWYAILRDFLREKRKKGKEIQVPLPFNDKHGNQLFEIIPTFSELDSISMMHLTAGDEIMNKNDIGESGGSHLFMREGLGKAQMMHELPTLAGAAHHYILSTAHIGTNNAMSSGPGNAPPRKQLQFLPTEVKIKGVTGQFLYMQHNLWMVTNCKLLWNDADKSPKFPKRQGEGVPEDKDLNQISVQHVRGKAGPSGFKLDIIVSQAEGILPSLTEFQLCKDYDGFGFQGNDRTYQLCLVPEETLQRTTIRQKFDESKSLRRAMNITSELAQMHQFHRPYVEKILMGADELYTKLKERGYDINWLLENTRGWWTYNNDLVGDYFLSTRDLLEMAHGTYHPYFLDKDCKTVKKAFLRK